MLHFTSLNEPQCERLTPYVRGLIDQRLVEYDDPNLATFYVMEAGDTPESIGFIWRVDGEPLWEFVEEHEGHYEAVLIVSDYGDGRVLLVPKAEGLDADTVAQFATWAEAEARIQS